MKILIRLETIVPFVLSIYLIQFLPISFAWWVWILLFLLPDISMIGYLNGNKVGAFVYNLFHHQILALIIAATGWLLDIDYLILAGLILLGHSSL